MTIDLPTRLLSAWYSVRDVNIDEKNYHRVNGGGSIDQQIWPPQGANFCHMHRDKLVKCYKKSIKSDDVSIAIQHFM